MRISSLLLLAPFTLLVRDASAQVLITEIMSDTATPQVEVDEWIEIQNTGTATVILDGWTLNDYEGADPAAESATRWTFPAGSMLAPAEVIVVTRQSIGFNLMFGQTASYELAETIDDPNVPNLTPAGGTDVYTLVNSAGGDAVVLRDNQGAIVSAVEWGTIDRTVPGTPFTSDPNQGSSLFRVDTTGNSADDFDITNTPTPFVGFMSSQTLIVGTAATPRNALYGSTYSVSTMVTDADGINTVEIYFGTATSSAGPASGLYLSGTMTASGSTYTYMDQVQNLAGGFPEPEDFHSRYLRWFILVEDNNNDLTTDPLDATEVAGNENYLPVYVQNVVPTGTTAISDVREPAAEDVPAWVGHSVRVQGVALVENGIMEPTRTLFTIQDGSGAAIPYFQTSTVVPDFTVGDELVITGVVGAFLGSTQLTEGQIEVTGNTGNVPETTLTLEQIIADGEQYEAQLVKVDDVDFVDARTTWPSDPNDPGSWNVPITDGTNEIVVRVTTGATGVFGQPAPQYGFDIRGVLNERNGTWQLFPREAGDISAHPMPPPPDGGMTGMDAAPGDSGGNTDTGVRPDSGVGGNPDTGTGGTNPDDEGCKCGAARHGSSSSAFGLILLALCAFIRRRK